MTPPVALDDYRERCDKCRRITCRSCGHCTGCDRDDGAWKGQVRTDRDGRTLCRECRYDRDDLGLR